MLCREWGGIDVLRAAEAEPPALPNGGVRIAVAACGVNFADLLMLRGEYQEKPPFPFAPGMEVAGVALDVAPGVDHVRSGDRVLALLDHGGYAEQAVARGVDVTRLPDAMDFSTAAGFAVAYATSHLALRHRAQLQPGEVLLVHGASGGVGLTAVEVGHALGATVVASASSAEKLAVVQAHGADHLLNSATEDISERLPALTGGADVVYDPVGGDAFAASLRCINPGGRLLVIGFASGVVPQIPANHLLVKDASALGLSLGRLRRHRSEVVQAAMVELLEWYAQGLLHPLVSRTFPLAEAGEALALLQSRRATGKLVLTVGESEPGC